jgi:hypothetical protein
MGYEYDSQVNRELARTAMDIYKKAHKIDQPINESPQNLNEEVIRENVNGLIMNYISDVIILAEAQMGREMTDIEISEASDELLRRIDSISDTDKVAFINELSEAAGAGMVAAPTGAAAAPPRTTGGGRATGMGTARPGAASVGMRPTGGNGNRNTPDPASAAFDPSNYDATDQASVNQLFADVAAGMYGSNVSAGALLAQVVGQGGNQFGQG